MTEFTLKVDYANLPPEQKLAILKEMGFQEVAPSEHTTNCLSRQGSGLICDCLPSTTSWKAPTDVRAYLGETYEARMAFAEKRWEFENDGIGKSPGLWVTHLERTAPRYNS